MSGLHAMTSKAQSTLSAGRTPALPPADMPSDGADASPPMPRLPLPELRGLGASELAAEAAAGSSKPKEEKHCRQRFSLPERSEDHGRGSAPSQQKRASTTSYCRPRKSFKTRPTPATTFESSATHCSRTCTLLASLRSSVSASRTLTTSLGPTPPAAAAPSSANRSSCSSKSALRSGMYTSAPSRQHTCEPGQPSCITAATERSTEPGGSSDERKSNESWTCVTPSGGSAGHCLASSGGGAADKRVGITHRPSRPPRRSSISTADSHSIRTAAA
mmetsp:Transcript_37717/g.112744  ORF Transcript_37717/g.112744 Transcript_37717/m.112744 type:complete len:275 (-) Transcript_37717:823-1647(-)